MDNLFPIFEKWINVLYEANKSGNDERYSALINRFFKYTNKDDCINEDERTMD